MSKLTSKEKLFHKYAKHYQEYFGLINYDLYIMPYDSDSALACCNSNVIGRTTSIYYSRKWIKKKDLTNKEIEDVAFHEVLEMYMFETYELLKVHHSYAVAQTQTHNMIRMLENRLLPLIRKE